MNEANRMLIVLVCAAIIVLMAVLAFLTWSAPDDLISSLQDAVDFLDDNNTDAGKLIVTLAALAVSIMALLLIIVELAPEDEPKELRIEHAGSTMIVPADALRLRLEEAVLALPEVTAARSRVWTKSRAVAASLDLTVAHSANVAEVSQEAGRIVVDTVQTDLGLPVAGAPEIKIAFGGTKTAPVTPIAAQTPVAQPEAPLTQVETVDERVAETAPAASELRAHSPPPTESPSAPEPARPSDQTPDEGPPSGQAQY
jgi:hypothetical protein